MAPSGSSESTQNMALTNLRQRSGRIAFTYALSFLENVFELSYPWAIGVAINGLIAGQPSLLWPLVAIWLAHIMVGAVRQLYDTRLFSRLNARMAEETVRAQRQDGAEVSEITARVEMIEELIVFLEEDMPVLLAMTIGLIGSMVFLSLYDWGSGLVMLLLILPVLIINAVTGLKAFRTNVQLNSLWEKQVDVISDPRPKRWHVYFGRMAKWRIRLSDLDATSWTLAEGFTLLAVIIVLVRAASGDGVMAGDVFAILSYALRVQDSLDGVPSAVQQIGRLIDIRRRIRNEGHEDDR